MKKRFIAVVAFLSLFIAGLYLYNSFCCSDDKIILNGNVEIQDVNISFRVPGRVSKIMAEEGDFVKKGDILAILDTDILENQMKLAQAQMEESVENFYNSEKDYKRNLVLLKNKSISEKIYDDSVVKYKVAKAKKDAAMANYELSKIQLNDTKLVSPIDGTILTRNIEPGEMVTVGGTAFSLMPNLNTRVKTFASESILSKIKYDDVVYVSIDSIPNKKFKGHIGFISSEAEFTPKNIETKELRASLMYRIRVIVDESSPELKHGMPVTITYNKE